MTSITRLLASTRIAALAALLWTGCATNPLPIPIEVEASAGGPLATATALEVLPVRPAKPTDRRLSPATADSLRQRAEEILRAKGHAIARVATTAGIRGEGDMLVEIVTGTEIVPRRTWSSDPDASGPRTVERTEQVLRVRVHSRVHALEIWRSEARRTLRGGSPPGSTDGVDEKAWRELLEAAMNRAPDRE